MQRRFFPRTTSMLARHAFSSSGTHALEDARPRERVEDLLPQRAPAPGRGGTPGVIASGNGSSCPAPPSSRCAGRGCTRPACCAISGTNCHCARGRLPITPTVSPARSCSQFQRVEAARAGERVEARMSGTTSSLNMPTALTTTSASTVRPDASCSVQRDASSSQLTRAAWRRRSGSAAGCRTSRRSARGRRGSPAATRARPVGL